MKSFELKAIGKKIIEGKKDDISGLELLAYILGDSKDGGSSVALAMDLLSHFGGWEALFQAEISDLEDFKRLKKKQIISILLAGRIKTIMEEKEG